MWHTVAVYLQGARDGQRPEEDIWEERIVLIDAEDASKAAKLARELTEADSLDVLTISGHTLRWRFSHVGQVCALDEGELRSGTELWSRFLKDSEARSLMRPFEDS
jgi:hypothetical protein